MTFEDVTVRYGSGRREMTAVDRVHLTVPSGAVVGLVGESGSGKSTLARAAVGLTPVAGGRILLDGRPLPRGGRRPLQMVFQDPYSSLDPRMTIGSSIAEAIRAERCRVRRPAATRWPGCWTWWTCPPTAPGATRPSCPAGSGSGSRWRGRSPGGPTW
ncbi:ATP-binding cassette domain-containing protein [Catellatospora coxensis]